MANSKKLSVFKFLAIFSAAMLTVFLGRAALAYYGNISICFKPFGVVSDQDHIDSAVSYLKRQELFDWEMRHGGGKANVDYLKALDPKTCCKVLKRGRWSSESFNKVTFYTTFTGSYSRVVDSGPMPIYHPNAAGYARRYRVPTTVCAIPGTQY